MTNPNLEWLDDPEVFRVNQCEAHSDHCFYLSEEACQSGRQETAQSLNGRWKFSYSTEPSKRPVLFYEEEFDHSGFDEITVPGHIELAGYCGIHYINTMYPWEAKIFRRPPYTLSQTELKKGLFSDAPDNPVGSYVCRFDLDDDLRGKSVRIRFDGVEQAMYVWLNGAFVGYAEDSFTPSEFDLTPWIRDEGNLLAVEVYKRSTAAFLEDQDFFRFFGIFRDVTLLGLPPVHVEDVLIRTDYDEAGWGHAEVRLRLLKDESFKSVNCHVCLLDEENGPDEIRVLAEKTVETMEEDEISISLQTSERISLWDHDHPKLYKVLLRLSDKNGNLIEVVPYEVGFRRLEIRDKVMYLNGRRLIINGVNRHEWSPETGRSITEKEEQWDMDCLKRNHINAVRTCHYPDRLSWYSMCDREGIYMMAEVNMECHGSWQKNNIVEASWNIPGSLREWEAAVLDRARTQYEVLKNHTSILFWSLGNESYAGDVIEKENAYYKRTDPTRLTHYESVYYTPNRKGAISDVESRMYAPPSQVIDYLENEADKPYLLCEYMHDMGNSLGGMDSYMSLLDRYDMYQGGFIWDYIDQALYVEDEVTGQKVLRYGGDFDDRPSDYEFSGNGIVFADRTEKPAMQEVRYYYDKYRQQ